MTANNDRDQKPQPGATGEKPWSDADNGGEDARSEGAAQSPHRSGATRIPSAHRAVNENTGSTEAARSGVPVDPDSADDDPDSAVDFQRPPSEGGDVTR